jgi:hypothetical protein
MAPPSLAKSPHFLSSVDSRRLAPEKVANCLLDQQILHCVTLYVTFGPRNTPESQLASPIEKALLMLVFCSGLTSMA